MISNEKGLTFMELIVAIAIMSIIAAASYSIFTMGLRGFQREADEVDDQFNVRYAASYIGREIRKADTVNVSVNVLTLGNASGTTMEFKLVGNTINKNSEVLASGIKTFTVNMNGNTVELVIESEENSTGSTFVLKSEIVIRN